jgi:hypothetical protein
MNGEIENIETEKENNKHTNKIKSREIPNRSKE